MLSHSIGCYCRIGQCIGRRKNRNLKQTFSWRIKRKVPDFVRNQELFGGDYWTRTSDLLRVKIRLDIKCLLLGPFRHLLLHFFRTGRRLFVHCVHPLISGYWSAYWSNPRLRQLGRAGDAFRKRQFCCRDRSLQSRKCQALFSVQTTCHARPLPHRVVGKYINKTNDNKLWATAVQKSILK